MARSVATVTGPNGKVRVYWSAEWEEYSVVPTWEGEDAIYRTDDAEDALSTARVMAGDVVSNGYR